MKILLVGKSREVFSLACDLGFNVVAAVDCGSTAKDWQSLPMYSSDEDAIREGGFDQIVLAIDHPEKRRDVYKFYTNAGFSCVPLLSSPPGPGTRSGPGLSILRHAHISTDCSLGTGVRLNIGATIMHDGNIGDFVTLAPGAVVLGKVSIGELSYIGANATVLTGITIGSRCMIGAGAVVTKDIADGRTVMGVPAR